MKPMKKFATLICAGVLATAAGCAGGEKVTPPQQLTRVSRGAEHDQRMAWWRDARFGMFIHWGLYAVPAGEWHGKPTSGAGEWIMRNAKIPVPEYEPLAKQFNPVNYNASEWVRIAKDAGCKYIVITSKHHDGFSMFDSKTSDYDVKERTPFARDPLAELAKACREQGMKLCFYYSIWDWHHPDFKKERMAQYNEYMRGQLRELLTNYGDIGLLWFDGEWPDEWTEEQGKDLEAFCRSIKPDVIINNRVGKARADMAGHSLYQGAGDYDTPEQEVPARGLPNDWETCMTMNDTWGFRKDDHHWKSDAELIHTLVDIASKGGNFLLNVGPTSMGEIPPESVDRMAAIGRWMKVNSESIYGTDASPIGRFPWGRATSKGKRLYLHVFDWPTDGNLKIAGLRTPIRSASLLSSRSAPLQVTKEGVWTTIHIPAAAPTPPDSVIIAEFDSTPVADALAVTSGADGSITLDAVDATLHGTKLQLEHGPNYNLGFWAGPRDSASWNALAPSRGTYRVQLEVAAEAKSAGQHACVKIGDATLPFKVPETKGWNDYVTMEAGTVTLTPGKPFTVEVSPTDDLTRPLMNLRRVTLTPTK